MGRIFNRVTTDGVANFRIFGVSRDSKWEDSRLKKSEIVVCFKI